MITWHHHVMILLSLQTFLKPKRSLSPELCSGFGDKCLDQPYQYQVYFPIYRCISLCWVTVTLTGIQRRSQTLYTNLCNGMVSHGAQIGGLQVFADHMQKQTHPRSSQTVRHLTHAYLHAANHSRCRWHYDICTWRTTVIFDIKGKTQRPPIWALCQDKKIKMAQVLGSPLYICGYSRTFTTPEVYVWKKMPTPPGRLLLFATIR